jgi:hypothetical protein
MYWSLNLLLLRSRRYRLKKITIDLKKIKFIKRSKFVREQRFFSKIGKGPVKSKSNSIIKILNFVLAGNISNTPPLSTNLTLYGVNSQKFVDDFNIFCKNIFDNLILKSLSIKVLLYIFKDFSFKFIVCNFKLSSLYFLDLKSLYGVDKNLLLFKSFDAVVDEEGNEEDLYIYLLDIYVFYMIMFLCTSIFEGVFAKIRSLSFESFIRVSHSSFKSFGMLGNKNRIKFII